MPVDAVVSPDRPSTHQRVRKSFLWDSDAWQERPLAKLRSSLVGNARWEGPLHVGSLPRFPGFWVGPLTIVAVGAI